MSGRFNRFKSRKSNQPSNKDPDSDTSSLSGFDEQGFLCPICYQKFTDQSALAQHYVIDHPQPSGVSNDDKTQDSTDEVNSLKQKFKVSEESRLLLIDALKQEKERVNDLESDLQVLQKQLRHAQTKLSEQVSPIDRPMAANNNIESLRSILVENQTTIDRFLEKFSSFENELNEKNRNIENDFESIQQTIRFLRERKISFSRNFRFLNEKLMNELRLTRKQNQSYRQQIENLNSDIQQLEVTISMYKEEHLRLMETNNSSQDEQSNLLRRLSEEKNLLEQQNKDLRQQIKLLRQGNEEEANRSSRQILQLTSEKNRFEEEIFTLKSQLNRVENERESQKKEFDQWKIGLTKQIAELENEKYTYKQTLHQNERTINELKFQLKASEIEKIQNENVQNQMTQMKIQFHKKDAYIRHLTTTIHRCAKLAHRVHKNAIELSEKNLSSLIEQIDASPMKTFVEEFGQSFQQIQLAIGQREKRFNEEKVLLRQQIRDEYRQLIATSQQQKEQIERLENQLQQLTELKRNLNDEREKCIGLEKELESRTKRQEMQLSALKENLATVRTELKSTNEKLALLENIRAEKTDVEARLVVSQDERRVLLERSLASENKNEKLLNENGQLSRKKDELDAALNEMARECQVLQMQMTKLSQRRWLNDDDIHACMKCHQTFSITQRKHHCRSCGNIFCDPCSSKNAVVAASSKKPQRVCDQCYKDLTS